MVPRTRMAQDAGICSPRPRARVPAHPGEASRAAGRDGQPEIREGACRRLTGVEFGLRGRVPATVSRLASPRLQSGTGLARPNRRAGQNVLLTRCPRRTQVRGRRAATRGTGPRPRSQTPRPGHARRLQAPSRISGWPSRPRPEIPLQDGPEFELADGVVKLRRLVPFEFEVPSHVDRQAVLVESLPLSRNLSPAHLRPAASGRAMFK